MVRNKLGDRMPLDAACASETYDKSLSNLLGKPPQIMGCNACTNLATGFPTILSKLGMEYPLK